MIFTSKQIVWTPVMYPGSLAISLNREFTEACLKYKCDDLPHLMKVVWRDIEDPPRHMPSNFLDIYQGILPRAIYLDGGKGLWLEIDSGTLQKDYSRPPTYHGHNEDLMPDRFLLLSAFGAWASAATALLDWK